MEWNVKTVDVYPTKDEHTNVIFNVHWRVSKTEGEDYSASSYGTQTLNTDDLSGFIDFDLVTTAEVQAWVIDAMGEEAVTELEANLDAQIESEINPTIETKTIGE